VASERSRLLNEAGQGRVRIGEEMLRPFDIAVLVRTNVQARAVRDALKACRIPCVLYSDENVFFSREAFEMEVLLFALAEPSSEGFLRAALMTRIFSFTAAKIDGLMEDEAGWEAWIERFRDYHDLWNRMGFTPMFRRLLDREDVRSRLLAGNNGERALTNVLHLAELLGRAETQEKLGMRGLLKWLSERRDPEATENEEYQLRLESDDDAVRVMTVHKSKGLEFPVVFCPFAWASVKTGEKGGLLFHDKDDSPIIDLDPDRSGPHAIQAAREALAENVRLFYVSLTRAKNRCYMAWGAINGAETSAPAYLMRSSEVHGAEDPVKALQDGEPVDESMRQNLEGLLAAGSGHAEVRDIPLESPIPLAQIESPEGVPEARAFNAAIDRTWGIASYSSFIAGLHRITEPADRDALMLGMREGTEDKPASMKDIFSFPRGARAGTLLHEVFERIDFTVDDAAIRAVVEDTLSGHGFDGAWADVVTGMIRRVLGADLGGVSLAQVSGSERLSELEFFFPLKVITSKTLEAVLADCIPGHMPDEQQNQCHFDRREKSLSGEGKISRFARDDREVHSDDNIESRPMFGDVSSQRLSEVISVEDSTTLGGPSTTPSPLAGEGQGEGAKILPPYRFPRLTFDPVKGFLRGFMDLVFRHDGKYYLIDWKSNHLGSSAIDYHQAALSRAMVENHYILQYHLYTVALHQYLRHRLEGYSYDEHFGGVFYVFLRGVDPEVGPEYGIFRARPDEEIIMRLSEVLIDKVE
jgi:exodeoxyribonuclease V beta subunit